MPSRRRNSDLRTRDERLSFRHSRLAHAFDRTLASREIDWVVAYCVGAGTAGGIGWIEC